MPFNFSPFSKKIFIIYSSYSKTQMAWSTKATPPGNAKGTTTTILKGPISVDVHPPDDEMTDNSKENIGSNSRTSNGFLVSFYFGLNWSRINRGLLKLSKLSKFTSLFSNFLFLSKNITICVYLFFWSKTASISRSYYWSLVGF